MRTRPVGRRWTIAVAVASVAAVLKPAGFDNTPWAQRVQLVDARYAGPWELPAVGAVTAPVAVLIRPDGHVAWVGDLSDEALPAALTTWFGPPAAA